MQLSQNLMGNGVEYGKKKPSHSRIQMYLSKDTIQWTNIRYKSNDIDINATIWRLVFRNAHYILHFYELEWVKLTKK